MSDILNQVDTYTIILLAMLAAMLALLIFSMIPRKTEQQQKPSIKTLVKCVEGHEVERDFKAGDYVGKKVECPKCGKDAVIIAIYSKQTQAGKP